MRRVRCGVLSIEVAEKVAEKTGKLLKTEAAGKKFDINQALIGRKAMLRIQDSRLRFAFKNNGGSGRKIQMEIVIAGDAVTPGRRKECLIRRDSVIARKIGTIRIENQSVFAGEAKNREVCK